MVRTTTRFPDDVYNWIKTEADKINISINSFIVMTFSNMKNKEIKEIN